MRSSELPSLFRALAVRFAVESGIDPDHLIAVACGEVEDVQLAQQLVTALYPLVSPKDFLGLTARPETSTIHTMHTRTVSPEPARVGRPSRLKDHPLMKALMASGVSLAEEAKAVKRSVSSVRSFCFPPDDVAFRPVPEDLKRRWKDEYGVPLNSWPKKGV